MHARWQAFLGIGAVVGAGLYTAWSFTAQAQLAGIFIELQSAVDGAYGIGLTLVGTFLTTVGITVAALSLPYAVRALVARGGSPESARADVVRMRLLVGAPALGVWILSVWFVAAALVDPTALVASLGWLTKPALVLVPLLPLSFTLALETFLPVRWLDGHVEAKWERSAPVGDDEPVFLVRVASSDTSVPKDVFDDLAEGQRVGIVRTGGMLGLFIAITKPRSGVGPYR